MIPAGLATAAALEAMRKAVEPGITPLELDAIAEKVVREAGGRPNFMMEPGYRHTICANVNSCAVHGIPDARPLQPGDIVSLDAGAEIDGWHGDAAITVVLPDPEHPEREKKAREVSRITRQAMLTGVAQLARAKHLGEIGRVVEGYVKRNSSFAVLEDYIGHGIGRAMHEDPPVFNVPQRRRGAAVKPGLAVAVEPIVSAGRIGTYVADDGWSVMMRDESLSAQWEHSVAVHEDGIWVLTALDGGVDDLRPLGITPTLIP